MKVQEFFGLRKVSGDVAVEIEVEGRKLPAAPMGWRAEADGSLKAAEAVEYVMDSPVSVDKLSAALQDLQKAFQERQSVFDKSYRAGIHVHVNVQKLDMVQLATMISGYFIFENSLVNFCDPFRKGNHFCLRASDAGGQIRHIKRAFVDNDPNQFRDDSVRYSSMNVCAIPKYGSVEFRSLESTPDFDKVQVFASLHNSLRNFSQEVKDPHALMDLVQHFDPAGLCEKIFKADAKYLLTQGSFFQDTESGLEFAEDLAYCRPWGVRSLDIFAARKEVF